VTPATASPTTNKDVRTGAMRIRDSRAAASAKALAPKERTSTVTVSEVPG
jgi:hypothetical protein